MTTDSAWFSTVTVGGLCVKFKLDTGAKANVLPFSVYSKLQNKSPLIDTSVVLSSYGDFKVKPEGKVTLACEAQGLKESLPFFVAAVNSPPILGLSACSKLNLVKRVESVAQAPSTKEEIVDEFAVVFSGLGRMKGKYHIELDAELSFICLEEYRIPYLKNLKQKVDRPTPWVNSLVIVEKHDGSLRLSLDPRLFGENTIGYPQQDIASCLSGKKVFSTVDEKDGFWQVRLDDESSHL